MAQKNNWDSIVDVYQSHKRNTMLREQNDLQRRLRNIFSVNSLKSSQYFRCNVYSR